MDVRRRRGRRHRLVRVFTALVAAVVVLELAAAAAAPGRLRPAVLPFGTADGAASGARAAPGGTDADPSGPGRSPGPADDAGDGPSAAAPADPAALLTAGGVVLAPGWAPEGILGGGDPWASAAATDGAAAWVSRLTPRVELVLDGEPFRERAVVGRDPAPCYHFHRSVRDVSVGLPDPVGARIEADLMAWLEPPYFSGVVRSRLDPRCVGRPRSQYGFAIEEVYRVPCAPPRRSSPAASATGAPAVPVAAESRDVRCFVVGQWAYHLGERDVRWSAHLVYDAGTGELLTGEDLHVGIDVATWRAFVDGAVCALGGRCGGVAHRHGQVLSTATALVVEFAAGEADDPSVGTRRLVVPWEVVAGLAADASSVGQVAPTG